MAVNDLTPEIARMTINNARDSVIEAISHTYDIACNKLQQPMAKYADVLTEEKIEKQQSSSISTDKFPTKTSDLDAFFARIDALTKKKNQPDKVNLYKPSTNKIVIKGGKASNKLTERSIRYNDKQYLFAIEAVDTDRWTEFQKMVDDYIYDHQTDDDVEEL